MGKLNKRALLISLVLTAICALVLFNYIRNMQTPAAESAKTDILVSVKDFNPGEIITPEDIRVVKVSSDSVPEGIIFDKLYIEGMYANVPILIGEPFREERLAKKEELSLANKLEKGYRAFSIFINEANLLSMQLVPGDKIDIIATWTFETKENLSFPYSYTILQNIEVLSLGPNRVADAESSMPNRGGYNIDDMPKTITLAVTPQQAETLALNAQNSTISVALRGLDDENTENTEGAIIVDQLSKRLLPFALKPGDVQLETPSNTSGSSGLGTGTDVFAP